MNSLLWHELSRKHFSKKLAPYPGFKDDDEFSKKAEVKIEGGNNENKIIIGKEENMEQQEVLKSRGTSKKAQKFCDVCEKV